MKENALQIAVFCQPQEVVTMLGSLVVEFHVDVSEAGLQAKHLPVIAPDVEFPVLYAHQSTHDVGRMSLLIKRTELVLRRAALWFPVEHSPAFAVCIFFHAAYQFGIVCPTLVHLPWISHIDLESCLHYHHVTTVFLRHLADVLHAIVDGDGGIILFSRLYGPVRIERHSYHVPLSSVLFYDVKVSVVEGVIKAIVEMYYHYCFGEYRLHCIISCPYEPSILLRVLFHVPHSLYYRGVTVLILFLPSRHGVHLHGPQQPVGCLVAHLHPFRRYVVFLQEREHLHGMCGKRLPHLPIVHHFPRRGYVLLGGVSPPVAVMEVNHHVHPESLCTLCFL